MIDLASQIGEGFEVVGSDGAHVGTVDWVEGYIVWLTKGGDPGDHHRFVPMNLVASVHAFRVTLNLLAEEADRRSTNSTPPFGKGSID